jgi:hypothetical protein
MFVRIAGLPFSVVVVGGSDTGGIGRLATDVVVVIGMFAGSPVGIGGMKKPAPTGTGGRPRASVGGRIMPNDGMP